MPSDLDLARPHPVGRPIVRRGFNLLFLELASSNVINKMSNTAVITSVRVITVNTDANDKTNVGVSFNKYTFGQ